MNEYQVVQFTIEYLKEHGLINGPISNEMVHTINALVQKQALEQARKYGFASINIPKMNDPGDEA